MKWSYQVRGQRIKQNYRSAGATMRASVEKKPINQDQVPSFISLVLLFARLNDMLSFFLHRFNRLSRCVLRGRQHENSKVLM